MGRKTLANLTAEELRAEFPVHDSYTYLDSAYWGPYPKRTSDAISDFVQKRSTMAYPFGRADEDRVFVDEVRSKMAKVLNVTPEEVWFPKGTTDAISTVANALLRPGDEILVGGLDHPADYAVWSNLAERGIRVTVVPQRDYRMDAEDIERAISPQTRAIGMCLVNTYNGYRQDLDALSRVAGEHGLYLFLDAIQGMGHLDIDVANSNVTMMSAGAYKWLCSPEGLGVSYVSKDVIEDIIPHNVHFYSAGSEPVRLGIVRGPDVRVRRVGQGTAADPGRNARLSGCRGKDGAESQRHRPARAQPDGGPDTWIRRHRGR